MGDLSIITLISVVPLLVILMSVAIALIAWRLGSRVIRIITSLILVFFGFGFLLLSLGLLFSFLAGIMIMLTGLVLLISELMEKKVPDTDGD